jgi:hypothetical protein
VLGELARDVADAGDVGVPVGAAEAQVLGEVGAHLVAVEQLDPVAAAGQVGRCRAGQGGLAGAGQAGEPQHETGGVGPGPRRHLLTFRGVGGSVGGHQAAPAW